ncbi:hypothetical protein TELCIR_08482 [Teladorsagia circumcincta]|uniref:Aminotransferase class I/classII domain-containing protein n=1 Tax=Teladorsagia circumcincta TaxID=45464 RepID=A0A2G9UHH6_TELCI|nr:hypothetical protein TELCIR_08482 [Teladorsagia circumcincta]
MLIACVANPALMEKGLFPSDVVEHAKKRDGVPCDYENVILSSGATDSIRNVLKMFVRRDAPKPTGIMIPIPQYPLYSATIEEFGLGKATAAAIE